MTRFIRILLVTVLILAAASIASAQQRKKENKGLVASDRSQVDADYAFQGEYVGRSNTPGGVEVKLAAQVVAQGDGNFQVVGYVGGLPGDGWNRGDRKIELSGKRESNLVVLSREDERVGSIADGKMSIIVRHQREVRFELEKIERTSPTMGAEPPTGAMVIFDGSRTENFTEGKLNEEKLLWAGATTKPLPEDYVLHLEFITPYMPKARGQGRGNSGVYLHDCYELQVLDSFGLEGHDNECGGFYKVKVPAVNMCLPPLVWQTYDVDFTAPKYDAAGKKIAGARATVRHNGVVIHDDLELAWTPGRRQEGPGPRGIHLQQHGNKVQYRNIWVK